MIKSSLKSIYSKYLCFFNSNFECIHNCHLGDVILIGQLVENNSQWIAQQFYLAGVSIYKTSFVQSDVKILKK